MPKILVVEEGASARDSLGAVFEAAGVEPEFVSSSREALERFQVGDIDLVLTEVRLPVMDGLVLTRKLRQIDPDVVVLCMTAWERKGDLRQAIREQVFDFFVKPFSAGDLIASLKRAAAHRERWLGFREAARQGPLLPPEGMPEGAVDPATLKALEAREQAVAEREAALERAVAEFEAMGMGLEMGPEEGRPGGGADAGALDERAAALDARELEIADREELLAEREAFLEQSENALFEKGQRLQEIETELDHRADGMGVPVSSAASALPADAAHLIEELDARRDALEEKEREMEKRFGALLERERRLKKNEALIRAREQYLKESENILFETED